MIAVKRIYDKPKEKDGYRILIDRLWPRGVSKEDAEVDLWLKEIGPTDALRKWFDHRNDRWTGFKRKYKRQLNTIKRGKLIEEIKQLEKEKEKVTLLYGAKDEKHNHAVVLKEYMEE